MMKAYKDFCHKFKKCNFNDERHPSKKGFSFKTKRITVSPQSNPNMILILYTMCHFKHFHVFRTTSIHHEKMRTVALIKIDVNTDYIY